jgi:hypothetical protein
MIVLQSPDLLLRIDPSHGAEILDLVDLRSGRQLLGRPPFGSELPCGGDLDEEAWTASYRGGWQTVLPNAGRPCDTPRGRHGFHGRASNDPWSLVEHDATSARLAWSGHGLDVEKLITIDDGAVVLRYRITSGDGAPLVALEHIAVGRELLEPSVEIDLPAALAYELSETEGPATPPSDAGEWPQLRLLDGTLERADAWPAVRPRSRLFVLSEIGAGWAAVRNEARGQGLALAWDASWYRHCWVWHENRVMGGPWRAATEMLAIEPTTVPHTLGLAVAEENGQAQWIDPGEEMRPWIVARAFVPSGPVRGVDEGGRVVK